MKSFPKSPNLLVADAGPLIALARLDRLDLPGLLFARVLVPQRVLVECIADDRPGVAQIKTAVAAGSLVVKAEPVPPLLTVTPAGLGEGETAAIALAATLPDATLLMDDWLGRRVARSLGLRVVGVLGILVAARRRGDIDAVKPLIAQLVQAGYHLAPTLIAAVLADVGEK